MSSDAKINDFKRSIKHEAKYIILWLNTNKYMDDFMKNQYKLYLHHYESRTGNYDLGPELANPNQYTIRNTLMIKTYQALIVIS